jgi:hypothetical protein
MSAQAAPRFSMTALVAIVVPCRIASRLSGGAPQASSALRRPIDGSCGVEGTFRMRWEPSSPA